MDNNTQTQSTVTTQENVQQQEHSPIEIIQTSFSNQMKMNQMQSNIFNSDKAHSRYQQSKTYYEQQQRYNQQNYHQHTSGYGHFSGSSVASHTHRVNSVSFYSHTKPQKKVSEIMRSQNVYSSYPSAKKKRMALEQGEHFKLGPTFKNKVYNHLCFIHPYKGCSDFTHYRGFETLNLKFLKQNFKFKTEEISQPNSNINNQSIPLTQSTQKQNTSYINQLQNTPPTQNQLNYMMNMMTPNNMNKTQTINPISMKQQTSNFNMMMNMNQNNNNNQLYNINFYNNNLKALLQNQLNQVNEQKMKQNMNANNLILFQQYMNGFNLLQQQKKNNINPNSSDNMLSQMNTTDNSINATTLNNRQNIQNIFSFYENESFIHPYEPLLSLNKTNMNNIMFMNDTQSNPLSMAYTQQQMMQSNYNKNIQNNQIDTMDKSHPQIDEKTIEENLKTGKYLKGIIRVNKNLNHGYITVPGLDNDILIKGIRNLNQCLNLDEVIVELFPCKSWKPLVNKRNRKFSLCNDEETNDNDDKNIQSKKEENDEDIDILKTKEERLKYINMYFNLRPEGRIIKIIKSPNTEKEQIARIEVDKTSIFACPIDETIPKIFIRLKKRRNETDNNSTNNNIDNMYKNKYYLVKIMGWTANFKCPKGNISRELGACGSIDVESEVLLKQYSIDYDQTFSPIILAEIEDKLKATESYIDESLKNKTRVDLTNDLIFTIDPYTSKDLDDAVSVRLVDAEKNLLEIGVHIADPSFYIDKDSQLDQEAYKRATTIYLVNKNIPMLPRILSENICSIMPNQRRLAVSCTFRIFLNDGSLDKTYTPKFELTVVDSKAKWNYDLVQKIIEDKDSVKYEDLKEEDGTKPKTKEIFDSLVDSVLLLYKLTKLVRKQRYDSGSLQIKNDAVTFNLDQETMMPLSFNIENRHDSHYLVEELMLIANILCADFLYDNVKGNAIIRRHPYINDSKNAEIQRYLITNKINADFDDPQELNKVLSELEKNNYNKYICIQHKLKTFMLRAEYVIAKYFSYEELKHCALNFELYTHFTSPIRRYPDLLVHREIKEIIRINKKEISKEDFEKDFSVTSKNTEHFNEKYYNSKQISMKSIHLYQCIYLRENKKNMYDALIMDIVNKGNKRNNGGNNNEIVVNLLIKEINLEIEWRKEDNKNVIDARVEENESLIDIDYKTSENKLANKTLKTFDEVKIKLDYIDSIMPDLKCFLCLE